MFREKESQTKKLVEAAHSIMTDAHARTIKGELSSEQAKQQARVTIKSLRYDGDNYFWINDMQARIVMHPIKPELDGKDLSDFEDPNGKKLFSEFVAMVKQNGEGMVPYLWPKPGLDDPVEKFSYVKGFKPWGWIVGSGIYIDDVDAAFWRKAGILGGASLFVLILLLAVSIAVTRSIVKPIKRTTAALNDIATGEGDLTRRLDADGSDEVASLSRAFNLFTDNIQEIIIQVNDVSCQLATAAEELSVTSAQTRETISRQDGETQQVAAAVTEMAATVKEVARSAEDASCSAQVADEEARKGREVVSEVTTSIRKIAEEMSAATEVIAQLSKESEYIESVSETIQGIAEQTSLLALNAAIEAARAGEYGRGFAVVADEVRSLSARTQKETSEIQEMIERLQAGTQGAVEVVQRSSSTTSETVQEAVTAAISLEKIVESVATISVKNTEIASAAEEQSAVAQEIDFSLTQIAGLTEESKFSIQNIADANNELSRASEGLRAMMSRFKTH
jgi:methyl-accepting chemotaxis protein